DERRDSRPRFDRYERRDSRPRFDRDERRDSRPHFDRDDRRDSRPRFSEDRPREKKQVKPYGYDTIKKSRARDDEEGKFFWRDDE
ncbi:MAG: hypothetical protein SO157_05080, partial [Bullifex sp.]|nr:hypothetical protein [Bullifex sp.]